jgi:dienelactone hydrolase
MPDMFPNDPAPGSAGTHLIPESDNSSSLLEQVKLKAVEVTKSFFVDMWLARITPDKVMPILHKVIEAAQEEYAEVVKNGEGIYAVGYCVGGRFVLLLGREEEPAKEEGADDEESVRVKKGPYIRAGAVAHAASVSPDDFHGIAVPMSLVCVEDDPLFPDEVRTGGEDVMSKANLEHEVQVYPGVPHGMCSPSAGATSLRLDSYAN